MKITDLQVMRIGSEGTNNWTFVKSKPTPAFTDG